MAVGQQEAFLAWIASNKSSEFSKLKKSDEHYTDISGIPPVGVVVSGGQAYGGGTFTLGIKRFTANGLKIVHLGRWDWTGRHTVLATNTVSAAART